MKYIIAIFPFLAFMLKIAAQEPNVLFIGNSYTEVNDLPQMVYNIARSMGDNMRYASNTPGGCTFMQHCSNHSMEMICQGGWDIVVLQEQSQYPSFPQNQVENEVFPYAERLIDSIYAHSPCAEPMFYMTWGRRDGDQINGQYFPVLGTYEGMDSMLCERYTYMAETNDASLCPVGRVWRYIRTNHPEIELYQSDGSHPSTAGTYAAACAFYTMFFHRDPDQIGYNPGLDRNISLIIRNAVRSVVYENLTQWQRPNPTVEVDTLYTNSDNTVWFSHECTHTDTLIWNFGDGSDTTTLPEEGQYIYHTYDDTGRYTVTLTARRHCLTAIDSMSITINNYTDLGINHNTNNEIRIFPNPVSEHVTMISKTQAKAIIVNALGQTIQQVRIKPGENTIELRKIPCGVYTLVVTNQNNTYCHNIIKK